MADAPPSSVLATSPTLIQEKIRCVFLKLKDLEGVFQFWAPVKTAGGRWLLTTSDQPFALAANDEDFRKYRSCSVRYQYNLDKNILEVEEDPAIISDGAPARAFLNRLPELLSHLTVCRYYDLESSARQCQLRHSVMLPVFDPSEIFCVGVVEYSTMWCDRLKVMFDAVRLQLEKFGLKTFHAKPPYQTVCGLPNARGEIKTALKIISPKFCMDLVQVWIAYKDEKHVAFSSSLEVNRTKRMLGIKLLDHCSVHDLYDDKFAYDCIVSYSTICHAIPLKIGEGPIGKTLKNLKPHFIKRVSKLIDNQPLTMVRHSDGLGDPFECSCFVICLRSIHTSDFDYVFEFLWHEVPNYAILLESLLLSLKTYLPNFKYASGGKLGDELPIIYVEDSTKSNKVFRIFKGNKSSPAFEALENCSVGKECLTTLEAKCKTTPIPLSEEGMIEAAENLYVTLSTLKRKRGSQSNTNEEDTGTFQDPSANNREMCLDENTLTIKAEYADDMIKFTLPISSATFVAIQKEIGKGFELNPANYKLKYLDEDGDWILLKSDEDVKVCIKGRRNITSIVRLRLVPSGPSLTC